MCLSIPKRVVEWEGEGEFAGDFAWVERDGQRERVNMMLIGPQPVGSWVLTSLGLAKEVVEDEQRQLIEDALRPGRFAGRRFRPEPALSGSEPPA
jgi:hydrogenase expression/formation protein HypC